MAALIIAFVVRLLRRPRMCKACSLPRQKLDDLEEKQYLDKNQIKEESIKSVLYDVWWCARCRDTEVIEHRKMFTRYKPCAKCQRRTSKASASKTLQWATEYSNGLVEVTEHCVNCDYTSTSTHSTPMISRSSSYDSSSSSSSSYSSSSSSGGSSSGGGSSGSW